MEGDTELAELFELYNKESPERKPKLPSSNNTNGSASSSTDNIMQPEIVGEMETTLNNTSLEEENINLPEDNGDDADETEEPQPLSDKEAESRFILWYEEICKERMAMLEAEENYKSQINELEEAEERYRKRIKELDDGAVAMVQAFEQAQSETTALRKKYEPTDESDQGGYQEPYNDVIKHRDRLIKAETKYKKQIETLEEEVMQLRNSVNGLNSAPKQTHVHEVYSVPKRKPANEVDSVPKQKTVNEVYSAPKQKQVNEVHSAPKQKTVHETNTPTLSKQNKVAKQKHNAKKLFDDSSKIVVITGDEYMAKLEKENLMLKYSLERLEREMATREASQPEMTQTKSKPMKMTYPTKREIPVRNGKTLQPEITKTKYKSTKTSTPTKSDDSDKSSVEYFFTNQKHTPLFLPKIPTASSSGSLDDDRSTSVTSLNRTTQTPSLTFGLSYREIHSKKDAKRTDSHYQNISKYIV